MIEVRKPSSLTSSQNRIAIFIAPHVLNLRDRPSDILTTLGRRRPVWGGIEIDWGWIDSLAHGLPGSISWSSHLQHSALSCPKPLDTSLHLIKCYCIVSILEFFTVFTKVHDGSCYIFERELWCDLRVMELVDSDGGNIQSCKKTSPHSFTQADLCYGLYSTFLHMVYTIYTSTRLQSFLVQS